MGVPGSNLLNQAFRVIARNTVIYYQFAARSKRPDGVLVPTYVPPQSITGSVQAVPRNLYQQNGLDFNRDYVTFYTTTQMMDVEREKSGDQFMYNGQLYQCLSNNNWFGQDGWVGVLAVRTDGEAPNPNQFVIEPGTIYIVEPGEA